MARELTTTITFTATGYPNTRPISADPVSAEISLKDIQDEIHDLDGFWDDIDAKLGLPEDSVEVRTYSIKVRLFDDSDEDGDMFLNAETLSEPEEVLSEPEEVT